MWQKIKAFLSLNYICETVQKLLLGLTSALNVLNYIKDQIIGSKIADKIIPMLDKVIKGIETFKTSAEAIAKIICGTEVVAQAKSMSLQESLDQLDKITSELKK